MYYLNNPKIISMLCHFANFASVLGLQSYDFLFCYNTINQQIIFYIKQKYHLKRVEIPKKLVIFPK